MEHLSWWPERDKRVSESIFCIEARRLFGGRAVYARGAREHHSSRRHSADEHIQQALSCVTGAVSLEIPAGNPRGNGAPPALGAVSYLQNVVVDSGDPRA